MKTEIDDAEAIETDPLPRPEKSLMTLAEVANRLTMSEKHLRNMIESGRFPVDILRFGRSVRILTREFSEWISCSCPEKEQWTNMKRCKGCLAAGEVCRECRTAAMMAACSGGSEADRADE